MKLLSLSVVILLLMQSIHASPCQYNVNSTNVSEVQKLYEKGTDRFVTDSLEIGNFNVSDTYGSFEVFNRYGVPITIHLSFDYGFAVFAGPRQRLTMDINMTIPEKGSQKIQIGPNKTIWARFAFYNETMKYVFQDNNETYQRYETVTTVYEKCRTCLGKPCLDDGAACTAHAECGGRYCIQNRCNTQPSCFESYCGCEADEIQCPDASKCVPKNVLDLGAQPVCSPLECKTGYANSSSGECAISPETLEEEENARIEAMNARNRLFFIAGLAIMIIAVLIFLKQEFQRRKQESELEKRERKRAGQ